MLRFCLTVGLCVFTSACSLWAAEGESDATKVVPVWSQSPPDWIAHEEPERNTTGPDGRKVAGKSVVRLGYVNRPELHVFQPEKNTSDTSVLICPGGGYNILAWDLEGTEIAEWFRSWGVTAVVLKYRVPTRNQDKKWLAPVQDIQRSISLLRSGGVPGVQTKRVGVLGFSAGGNASARAALATERHYETRDNHDQARFTPDFAVLVYPAWLIEDGNPNQLIDDLKVTEQSPPMFFAHAWDDRVDCMSSVTLFSQLKQHGVRAALHIFSTGGHGFGSRKADEPTDSWPELCRAWMDSQGYLAP